MLKYLSKIYISNALNRISFALPSRLALVPEGFGEKKGVSPTPATLCLRNSAGITGEFYRYPFIETL